MFEPPSDFTHDEHFMTFLSRLADRLILQPTTHPIDTEEREQKWIETPGGKIETWVCRSTAGDSCADPAQAVLIKFPGAGGRAERARAYPAHLWTDIETEVWTVNQRGFGGSVGEASLQNFAESCDAVMSAIKTEFPDRQIVLYGNSLGCISALYLAARHPVAGVFLRNPPPLSQMIATRPRYAWWSFGGSKLIAKQVPAALDSIANAKQCSSPVLFVCSEQDRVIPPKFQQMIIDSYGGEFRKFVIEKADHHHRIPEHQEAEYIGQVKWLGQKITSPSN